MTVWQITFERPWWLTLSLLAIPMAALGWRALASVSPRRRFFVVAARILTFSILVVALAEPRWMTRHDRVSVIFLFDRSLSIPNSEMRRLVEFVNGASDRQRRSERADCVGVISFGRDAAVDAAPAADAPRLTERGEVDVDQRATNLSSAMKLAHTLFPANSSKRLVIVSDGNENLGDARRMARELAEGDVGIDVVPVRYNRRADVLVEKVIAPAALRKGEAFDVRVVLHYFAPTDAPESVSGELTISRRAGGEEVLAASQRVALSPGKNVVTLRQTLEAADFYAYEARFAPDDVAFDAREQNNRALAFAHLRGAGRALIVEDHSRPGEFRFLVERLRESNIEVDVVSMQQLFGSLDELQRYDTVVLANVARTSGDEASDLTTFTDRQLELLETNTRDLGAGLVMIGGPNSFGAGGWTNTPIERAMPVDFQIKNAKIELVGALALVVDRSGSMEGVKLEMAKAAAIAAAKQLGPRDYLAIVAFDSQADWVVPMTQGPRTERVARATRNLASGGGTDMYPGMQEAFAALQKAPAAAKHMIVLTDGQTQGRDFRTLVARMSQEKITVSTVAVGPDAAVGLLSEVARAGGGKFYRVVNPRVVPAIFMKEARRVSQPLIFEDSGGFQPFHAFPHEMTRGVGDELPPLTGLVMTRPKNSPLVEIAIASPKPNNAPVLAGWSYGLGKSVAFTTDAGGRWASAWTGWSDYDKFFAQMIRWSMRPVDENRDTLLATRLIDDRVEVTVTDLGGKIDATRLEGSFLGPDMTSTPFELKKAGPGRFAGAFPASDAGNYFLTIQPGFGKAPLRAGVNAPHSREFSDLQSNESLLAAIAAMSPKRTAPGLVVDLDSQPSKGNYDFFRAGLPRATSEEPFWQLATLSLAALFLFDVAIRRIRLDPAAAVVAARRTVVQHRPRKDVFDETPRRAATIPLGEVASLAPSTPEDPFVAPRDPESVLSDGPPERYLDRLRSAKNRAWRK